MRGEVDISDLSFGTYYRDDKCEELEESIRNDPKYAECAVKRLYWDVPIDQSPFAILDKNGDEIMMLERWEVDAMNDSEILSFIEVQLKRDGYSDRLELVSFLAFLTSVMIMGAFPISVLIFGYDAVLTSVSGLLMTAIIMFLISGPVYYMRHRNTNSKKRHIDMEAVRRNSIFLQALRNLAAVPESEYVDSKEYVKRLEDLENLMRGTIS